MWKNSSSVLVLRSRNWTSSSSSTSTSRKRALKSSVLPLAERAEELVGERLAGRRADGEAGVVGQQQVGDRAEQVRLADARGPADEQRVVGLRGHLGDGQRGGVGEAVAVADHELVEGELGVAERARARRPCGGGARARGGGWRRCASPRGGVAGGGRARLAAGPRARRSRSGPSTSSTLASMTLPKRSRIQRQAAAGPRDEALADELDRAQRVEPDAVGGLVDDERELGLHARPYVLELAAHGSVDPLPPGECRWTIRRRAPEGPVGRLYPTPSEAHREVLAIGGKNQRRRRAYTGAGESATVAAATPLGGAGDRRRQHEAHLPAKEAQARPRARVPRAHEHARGAPDAQAPPRQGPQAPVRLRPRRPRVTTGVDETRVRSARSGRLSRSAEFERVYRQGRSTANRHLVLYAFPNPAVERPRLGLSVSRKVGGAVERNRVKRLLREAFARRRGRAAPRARRRGRRPPRGPRAGRARGLAGVDAALAELIGRAGLQSRRQPPASRGHDAE